MKLSTTTLTFITILSLGGASVGSSRRPLCGKEHKLPLVQPPTRKLTHIDTSDSADSIVDSADDGLADTSDSVDSVSESAESVADEYYDESGDDHSNQDGDDESASGDERSPCDDDIYECPNGSFVSRNETNNCQFVDCPKATLNETDYSGEINLFDQRMHTFYLLSSSATDMNNAGWIAVLGLLAVAVLWF